jgi:hypothetical protein
MKKIVLTTLLLFFTIQNFAQNKQFQYAKLFQGQDRLLAESLAIDKDGNQYISGFFTSKADFDPGTDSFMLDAIDLGSAILGDAFLLKLNKKGDFLWAKQFGGKGSSTLNNIAIDPDGNIVAVGTYSDSIDVDPNAGQKWFAPQNGGTQVMLLKIDTSGKLVWAKTYGNNYGKTVGGMEIEPSGNILLVGGFVGKLDFDPSAKQYFLQANNSTDIFIQKLDRNGNFIWAKKIGNRFDDFANDLALDLQGNILVTGQFERQVDFDPGPDTAFLNGIGFGDVFILKLDSNGNYDWAKAIGGRGDDFGQEIATDSSGKIIITGIFSDTIDFDPGPSSTILEHFGLYDVFIQKLNQDGSFSWARTIGGVEDERVSGLDVSGNTIHVIGQFNKSVDFNPNIGTDVLKSEGRLDAFYLQLSTAGDYHFTKQIGGTSHQSGQAVKAHLDNEVFILGSFVGMTDFDPSANEFKATSTGSFSGYLVKLLAADCDSLSINVSLEIQDPKLTVVSNAGTYQWLNCDSNFVKLAGQTSKSFTAKNNGSYAVEVNIRGCKDTSGCVNLSKASAKFTDQLSKLNIYPNPSSGSLIIEGEDILGSTISIFSSAGQKVYQESVSNQTRFSTHLDLSPGTYLVQVVSKNTSRRKMWIVR